MAVKTTFLNFWDNAEIKSADFIQQRFPFHFHDTYSIGVIKSGAEKLILPAKELQLCAGSLVIIPPRYPHAHAFADSAAWSYCCIYLPAEFFLWLCRSRQDLHELVVIDNQAVSASFIKWHGIGFSGAEHFLSRLFQMAIVMQDEGTSIRPQSNQQLEELLTRFRNHPGQIYQLDNLAADFGMSKFSFIRYFKSGTGLTPHHCLMMYRVQKAKELLAGDHKLAAIAFDLGFFDQSHFHRNFRYFSGTTPKQFRAGTRVMTS